MLRNARCDDVGEVGRWRVRCKMLVYVEYGADDGVVHVLRRLHDDGSIQIFYVYLAEGRRVLYTYLQLRPVFDSVPRTQFTQIKTART